MILVGKPEGLRPLRRSIRNWEDNIKMNLRGIGRGGMDYIHLVKDRERRRTLSKTVMKLLVS
jgi:hypothetical protein